MTLSAVLLANGMFRGVNAKTSHGLVRGPSRYRIVAVVDEQCAGADAGEILDGVHRGIPCVTSVEAVLRGESPDVCVVGVATPGGVLPDKLRADLIAAAEHGLSLVSGLHTFLNDDPEIREAARRGGAQILDIRRPQPAAELRLWDGSSLAVKTPRIAVLGTDCAIVKRTTAALLTESLRERGLRC
ncbi:MAG: DUF1611 domain-containing protein, partial [Myxococcota bacterium]